MKLDRVLANDIKKQANGDGSREARFAFLKKVREAAKMMSTPEVVEDGKFDEAMKIYGRVVVSICVAATLYQRRERLDFWKFNWAMEVLNLWTNRTPHGIEEAYIDDGIHPTRICDYDYAGSFIRLTTEEE